VVILNVPCIIQDDNDHNAHILANELNKGNENVAILIHEENCLNKNEFCDNASFIPLPEQVMNELDTFVFDSPTCTKIRHMINVTCDTNELNLLSSLDTFGYIEYDVPCDLKTIEKRMFCQTNLPLFTRNNFHAIDTYDYNNAFMVYIVYICSDLNPHSIMQQYDQEESNNNTNRIISSSFSSLFKK
jgi:hypothetical protein